MLKKTLGRKSFLVFFLSVIIIYFCCFSRAIWEDNLKIVREHNIKADAGVYTYWLGMNQFADLVIFIRSHSFVVLLFCFDNRLLTNL